MKNALESIFALAEKCCLDSENDHVEEVSSLFPLLSLSLLHVHDGIASLSFAFMTRMTDFMCKRNKPLNYDENEQKTLDELLTVYSTVYLEREKEKKEGEGKETKKKKEKKRRRKKGKGEMEQDGKEGKMMKEGEDCFSFYDKCIGIGMGVREDDHVMDMVNSKHSFSNHEKEEKEKEKEKEIEKEEEGEVKEKENITFKSRDPRREAFMAMALSKQVTDKSESEYHDVNGMNMSNIDIMHNEFENYDTVALNLDLDLELNMHVNDGIMDGNHDGRKHKTMAKLVNHGGKFRDDDAFEKMDVKTIAGEGKGALNSHKDDSLNEIMFMPSCSSQSPPLMGERIVQEGIMEGMSPIGRLQLLLKKKCLAISDLFDLLCLMKIDLNTEETFLVEKNLKALLGDSSFSS